MVGACVECRGPLSEWAGPLAVWLDDNDVSAERSVRTVRTFARFSSWMSARGLDSADLSEDVIDEYIAAEQERSGSPTPAAFQYLPLVKRFLAGQGVLVLRGPVSRERHGLPRLLVGPLSGLIVELVAWLKTGGYAQGTVLSVAETGARLSAWMANEGLGIEQMDDVLLARFVAVQARGPVPHPSSAHRIVTVRKWLLEVGLLTAAAAPWSAAATPSQQCLADWGQYLQTERGIGRSTVAEYQRWVQGFVAGLAGSDGSIDWTQVEVGRVNRYVADEGRGYSLASRRHLVTAMRSLLIWAWMSGSLDRRMTAAVLGPQRRRVPGLPRALPAGQVEAILAAADRTTPIGLRDYAVVVIIARLGLRAGEVAGLALDDIDWHHGRLVVHGKGGRVLTLPLPVDVGEALVNYLSSGRPAAPGDRSVFVRARPPLVGLSGNGISGVVARLAHRAGLGTVHAHRLRHTTATAVLAHGGTLVEARELLGHARTDTTMAYARTDLPALRELAVPWGRLPGAAA